jgi:hypothetical protein
VTFDEVLLERPDRLKGGFMTIATPSDATPDGATRAEIADRFARAGLWLLPVYGVLLALSTLTQQPDYRTDFRGYAEYVTTDRFLVSHLGASIAGAALGLLGVVALLAFLSRGPAATAAIVGTALTVIGNVGNIALFGVAAFAQPAIGRAYLNGAEGVPGLNDDVYGTPLFATGGVAILCFVAGAILVGVAIARVGGPLRWPGIGYAASLALFPILFFTFAAAAPIAAGLFAAVALFVAVRLPRVFS